MVLSKAVFVAAIFGLVAEPLLGTNIGADQSDLPITKNLEGASSFKIVPERTVRSDDGRITISEYVQFDNEGFSYWKESVNFMGRTQELPALSEVSGRPNTYPAYFIISSDDQYLIRFQKLGAGESSIYLYRLREGSFVLDSPISLGDRAWSFYQNLNQKALPFPDFHMTAGLSKGYKQNYPEFNSKWNNKRYLVITLSGQWESTDEKGRGYVSGWACRYDLQKNSFDLPPELRRHNASAVKRFD